MSDEPENRLKETGNPMHEPIYLVSRLREHGNYSLGVLLTTIEGALGDTKQAQATKAMVRREMFLLIDRNQAEVYEFFDMQKPGLAPKEMWIEDQDEPSKEVEI